MGAKKSIIIIVSLAVFVFFLGVFVKNRLIASPVPQRMVVTEGEESEQSPATNNASPCDYGCYEIKGEKVFWNPHGFGGNPIEVEGADSRSFSAFKKYKSFGSDKKNVYFETNLVVGADPASIQVVVAHGSSDGMVNVWLRDKNAVFEPPFYEKLEGADPDSFDYSFDPYASQPYSL